MCIYVLHACIYMCYVCFWCQLLWNSGVTECCDPLCGSEELEYSPLQGAASTLNHWVISSIPSHGLLNKSIRDWKIPQWVKVLAVQA